MLFTKYKIGIAVLVIVFVIGALVLLNPFINEGVRIFEMNNEADLEYQAEIIDYSFPEEVYMGNTYLFKIKMRNIGRKTWTMDDLFRLGINFRINIYGFNRFDVYKDVPSGDEIEFYFPVTIPNLPGKRTIKFQMVQDNVKWFGDMLQWSFKVKYKGSDYEDFDEFELILSEDDLKHFDKLEKICVEKNYIVKDENDWRKAEIFYDNQKYEVEVRIHGDSVNHVVEENRSYKLRVLNGKRINGLNEFSFVQFTDRKFNSIIIQFFANEFGFDVLDHKLVSLALNGGDDVVYYMREKKSEDYFAKNGLSNFSFISKYSFFDRMDRMFMGIEGSPHAMLTNDEIAFNSVDFNEDLNKNVYSRLYLLTSIIDESKWGELKNFIDLDYLIEFEALRALFAMNHDVIGDNLTMLHDSTSAYFRFLFAAEHIPKYPIASFELYLNRSRCPNNSLNYGEAIKLFSFINSDSDFRQKKYRKIYEIINDETLLNLLFGELSRYNNFRKKGGGSLNNLFFNINFLSNLLSDSRFLIQKIEDKASTNFQLSAMSVSDLNFNKFEVIADEMLDQFVNLKVTQGEFEVYDRIYFEGGKADIESILNNFDLAYGLNQEMMFENNELSLIFSVSGISLGEVSVDNLVTETELASSEVIYFEDGAEYEAKKNEIFVFRNNEFFPCRMKNYHSGEYLDKDLVFEAYEELWEGDGDYSDIAEQALFTLPNYTETVEKKDLYKIIEHDLSFSEIYINVLEYEDRVELELLPFSVAPLLIEKLELEFDDPEFDEEPFLISLFDENGDLFFETNDLANFSEYYFVNDLDGNLNVQKTKYRIVFQYLNNLDASVSAIDLKMRNVISREDFSEKDVNIAIAGLERSYLETKVDEELHITGDLVFYEDFVVPSGKEVFIESGTNIKLAPGVSFLSYSPVFAVGEVDKPIVVQALLDEPFGSFSLLNEGASGSRFEYFEINGGSEDYINGVYFSGMFNAYHVDDVVVAHSKFSGAMADDALNFKYSNSVVRDSLFEGNSADAIDFDYMEGEILDCEFRDNGNDSIDTSGSITLISGNVIMNSGDKCMSFGEESKPRVFNNLMEGCKIGVEVKDLSAPEIVNNTIVGCEIGINSYQKKEVFGGGHARVWNTLFLRNGEDVTFLDTFKGKNFDTDDSDIEIEDSLFEGEVYFVEGKGNLEKIKEFLPDYSGEARIGLLDIVE